jgi:transcriptional regulator with XRE-family HTH domain
MENPILAFRRAKGWSRPEFQKRSGISYQTLRNLEIGETRRISSATIQYLLNAGVDANIQERLDEWREKQQEIRRYNIS